MSSLEITHLDLEQGSGGGCFSDAEDGSFYSILFYSSPVGSYDDYSFASISDHPDIITDDVDSDSRRVSSPSDCSIEIESEMIEMKMELDQVERICRICHLGLETNCHESGIPIQLGCSCKDDLGTAHKQCAETWFKIKRNRTCEICHSVASNVVGVNEIGTIEQSNGANNATAGAASVTHSVESRSFWHGPRFLNFLLACMVFAFILSWFLHFHVQPS